MLNTLNILNDLEKKELKYKKLMLQVNLKKFINNLEDNYSSYLWNNRQKKII